MAIIKAKPTSPGRRFRVNIKQDLYKGRPEKTLIESKKELLEEITMEILQCVIGAEAIKGFIE